MTDEHFAKIGRAHIVRKIDTLEACLPGWCAMFYFTGSYEGDIAEADRLRASFSIPRDRETAARISAAKTKFVEVVAVAAAERDFHDYQMQHDWLYWLRHKLTKNK